jgi:cell division protein ZapA
VQVSVGGRSYRLNCRDGEEKSLLAAGRYLDARTHQVAGGLGAVGETRLILMAALLVAGELLDAQSRRSAPGPAADDDGIERLTARAERLADHLEEALRGA